MNQKDYSSSITANVSANAAFKGICRVSEWWVKNTEGSTQNLNDVFIIRFSADAYVTFKITEMVADKKIVWQVTDCYLPFLKDKTEWTNTKVVFKISNKNNLTQIDFTHVGLAPGIECYDMCIKGWDEYIKGSLPKLLSENKGKPS